MKFKIGVFAEYNKRGGLKLRAYTLWYNSEWSGCNEVDVEAENGTEAKQKAMLLIRRKWETAPYSIKISEV